MLAGGFSCSWAQNTHQFCWNTSHLHPDVVASPWLQTIARIARCQKWSPEKEIFSNKWLFISEDLYDNNRVSVTAPAWNMSPAHPRVWLMLAALHPPSSPWASDLSGGEAVQAYEGCPPPQTVVYTLPVNLIPNQWRISIFSKCCSLPIQASFIDHQANRFIDL